MSAGFAQHSAEYGDGYEAGLASGRLECGEKERELREEADGLRVRVVQLEIQLAEHEAADAEYEEMRQWATSPEQVQAMFDHFRRQREDAAVGAWVRANPPADIRMHSTQYRDAALVAGSSLTPEEPTR